MHIYKCMYVCIYVCIYGSVLTERADIVAYRCGLNILTSISRQ